MIVGARVRARRRGFETSMYDRRIRFVLAVSVAMSVTLAGVVSMAAQSPETLATSSPRPVALGTGRMSVTLAPASGSALSARLAAVGSGRKVYLVVKDLATNEAPEVLYQVYLGLPPDSPPKPEGIHYVGSFNFFNAVGQARGVSRSFDVTDLVKALQSRKELGDTASVTIVPTDKPRAAAKPVVAEIALVEQ
jgi:hypothetical protein